jgi:hypothetical protein
MEEGIIFLTNSTRKIEYPNAKNEPQPLPHAI